MTLLRARVYTVRQHEAMTLGYRRYTRREVAELAHCGWLVACDGRTVGSFDVPAESVHRIAHAQEARWRKAKAKARNATAERKRREQVEYQLERSRVFIAARVAQDVPESDEPLSLEAIAAAVEERLRASMVEPPAPAPAPTRFEATDDSAIEALGLSMEERRLLGIGLSPRRRRRIRGFPSNYNVPPY